MRLAWALLGCAWLSACAQFGSDYVERSRGSYIDVIALTDREELLSNLVRLRHSEAPVFMQIDSITASPDLVFSLGGNTVFDDSVISSGTLTPGITYAEQPTIVYKPLMGREFTRELLLPIKLRPIFILLENGWSLDTVLLPLARSINGVRNYERQFADMPGFGGEYSRFTRGVAALGRLQRAGFLTIGAEAQGEETDVLVMLVSDAGVESEDWRTVQDIFKIAEGISTIRMTLGLQGGAGTLALETRPLLGVMRYLSAFIEDSSEMAKVDQPEVHDRLGFQVLTGKERPNGAMVAVKHYGKWFAIRNTDSRSKEILMMLRVLFNLQAQVDPGGSSIALTLPVR